VAVDTLVRRGDILVPGEERLLPLWDTVTVPAAAPLAEIFFFRDGPAGKSRVQTNMKLAGQIPAGHVFRVGSVQLRPAMGTTLAGPVVPLSIANFMALAASQLQIEVSNVVKFETVFRKAPAGGGYFGAISTGSNAATVTAAVQNGFPSPVCSILVKPKIIITANENFLVRLRWVVAPVVTVAVPVICTLWGKMERPYQ
jgi:hypothetical protein